MCLPHDVRKETKRKITEKNRQLLNTLQTIETLMNMYTYISVMSEHFASLSDESTPLQEDDISDRIAAQMEPQQRDVLFRQIFNNSGNTSEDNSEDDDE